MIAFAVVIIVAYVTGVVYFHKHFVPGTVVNGVDCSFANVTGAEGRIADVVQNFKIKIVGREGTKETLNGKDFQLDVVFDESMNDLLEQQNPYIWPVEFRNVVDRDLGVTITYDSDMLTKTVDALSCMQEGTMRKPVSAQLAYQKGKGCYEIVAEDIGTYLIRDKVQNLVEESIKQLDQKVDLDKNDCYEAPKYYQDDELIVKGLETANKYVGTKVTYDYTTEKVVVDSDQIAEWLEISSKYKVTFDEDKVQAFVSDMAEKFDTIYTVRHFQTSYGYTIDVSSGDYGWWTDRVAEKDDLIAFIKEGKSGEKEPVYYQRAVQRGKDDMGGTYVEVNLTMQHVLLYKNGEKIAESDCVSGGLDSPTHTGIFSITYKDQKHDDHEVALVGEDYVSQVNYFIPFNNNEGLHDASWRSQFGGNIYKKNGSHGCVNLPYNMVATIFENVEKGMPVIVYEDPNVPSATTAEKVDEENE